MGGRGIRGRSWCEAAWIRREAFDARSGGFGSQPKFPHSGAIDLLRMRLRDVGEWCRCGGGGERTAAMVTLGRCRRVGSTTIWRAVSSLLGR